MNPPRRISDSDRLQNLRLVWQQFSPEVDRQRAEALRLLEQLGNNSDPSIAPLKEHLAALLAQLDATTSRVNTTIPKADQSLVRIASLEGMIQRQLALGQWIGAFEADPKMCASSDLLKAMVNVWIAICRDFPTDNDPLPLSPGLRFIVQTLVDGIFRQGRARAVVMIGCPNPFLVPILARWARLAIFEEDPVLCRLARQVALHYSLEGSGCAANVQERSIGLSDAFVVGKDAFDLAWLGDEYCRTLSRSEAGELQAALGQAGACIRHLVMEIDPRSRPLDEWKSILATAGYETRVVSTPELPNQVLVHGENRTLNAGGEFHLFTNAFIYDEEIESVADQIATLDARCPATTSMLPSFAPPPNEVIDNDLRVQFSTSPYRAIIRLISRSGRTSTVADAVQRAIGTYHGLRDVTPHLPSLISLGSHSLDSLVFAIDPSPATPLRTIAPDQLAWERILDDLLSLMRALERRGYVPHRLRPGWFVWCPGGLRFCSPSPVEREESEDVLSAIWWFFHDLASGSSPWRPEPVPSPRGVLPSTIPDEVSHRINNLMSFADLRSALRAIHPD